MINQLVYLVYYQLFLTIHVRCCARPNGLTIKDIIYSKYEADVKAILVNANLFMFIVIKNESFTKQEKAAESTWYIYFNYFRIYLCNVVCELSIHIT